MICWCDPNHDSPLPDHKEPPHVIHPHAERIHSSALLPKSKGLKRRWSPNSSTAWRTKLCTSSIAPNVPNSTSAKLDHPWHPFQLKADIKHHGDKPVANHFNQAGHSIHICVKGLSFLFEDNTNDRKDIESHLIDKMGTRKPEGINERLYWLTASCTSAVCVCTPSQWFSSCELNCRLAVVSSALFVCFCFPVSLWVTPNEHNYTSLPWFQ